MSPLTDEQRRARRAEQRRQAVRQRRMVAGGVVGVVVLLVVVLAASGSGGGGSGKPHTKATTRPHLNAAGVPPPQDPIPSNTPSQPIQRGPQRNEIALTFDDGDCATCVASIVRTLTQTGAHATLFPNGTYGPTAWDSQAAAIKRLIAKGQVTIGNHTFTHNSAVSESTDALRDDLNQNEQWINKTFGVTSRPFFRPPFGFYNSDVLAVAGELGYTRTVLWSGTLADSTKQTVPYVIAAMRHWAHPGKVILAHGNYPATATALPRLLDIFKQRHLRSVTLNELLDWRLWDGPARR
jgi:peptidoglycan/xylan/chitin deacetylase (PgdA/CDA1 family)